MSLHAVPTIAHHPGVGITATCGYCRRRITSQSHLTAEVLMTAHYANAHPQTGVRSGAVPAAWRPQPTQGTFEFGPSR